MLRAKYTESSTSANDTSFAFTVTVGASERNHFIVSGIAGSFELFQLVGPDYILNFPDQMRGRVGLAGGVEKLENLRASGAARNAGQYWQVKLADTSRGRVTIGDTTLLFQFIDAPPVPTPVRVASGCPTATATVTEQHTAPARL